MSNELMKSARGPFDTIELFRERPASAESRRGGGSC
jgi:hypothetical protein